MMLLAIGDHIIGPNGSRALSTWPARAVASAAALGAGSVRLAPNSRRPRTPRHSPLVRPFRRHLHRPAESIRRHAHRTPSLVGAKPGRNAARAASVPARTLLRQPLRVAGREQRAELVGVAVAEQVESAATAVAGDRSLPDERQLRPI
ncbi:hypothetical protein GCM10028864_33450 [Microlunatus parietis]